LAGGGNEARHDVPWIRFGASAQVPFDAARDVAVARTRQDRPVPRFCMSGRLLR